MPPKKVVFIICVNPVVAEILSYNTVLTSETKLYQRYFNPLFLLGIFRFKKYQNKSSDFKKYFFLIVFEYFRNIDFRLPVSINYVKYTWNMNGDEVTHAFEHTHEEADTQMVLHTTLSSEDVVFIADIDVLILMIYGYSKFMVKPI